MNQEIKSLALKQYFKYFMGWFIVAGILLVVTIGAVVLKSAVKSVKAERNNSNAPTQHLYDYADVLTDAQEADLRAYIAEKEAWGTLDIVIVTLNQEMGRDDYTWENNMMNFADDFYDDGAFGWNEPYGDGICLVDNWYEDEYGSQKGTWLSTTGKMEDTIGWEEEDVVLDAMYRYIDSNPYEAYCAAVDELADYGRYGYNGASYGGDISFFCFAFIAPLIIAAIYAGVNLSQSKAKDTTVAGTYVENGQLTIRSRTDQFLRKSVSSYRVSSSSSGGGSSHRGGGSRGSHRSSSGRSHGGGGRRR